MATHIKRDPDYCSTCYGEAKKKGRTVSLTTVYEYPVCGLCEQRIREGLTHYSPSNGTEFDIFVSRCERCRHYIDDPDDPKPGSLTPPYQTCAWGVLDRLYQSMWRDADDIATWFDPADLTRHHDDGTLACPAVCKRFRDKNDDSGDPPPRDCPGQMTFSDMLVAEDRVSVLTSNTKREVRR